MEEGIGVGIIEKGTEIEGYKGLYEISESGKVFTLRQNRYLERCGDEYGFHIVSLTDHNGKRKNWNVFKLWESAFPHLPKEQFKGSLKIKYEKSCELRDTPGIHF
jgi:hypothetical protein